MKTITKLICATIALVGLALDAATANGAVGDLFVSINGTGFDGGGSIYRYAPSGQQSTFAVGLSRPRGVTFDQFGNLFVGNMMCFGGTCCCQGTIVKITPDGVQRVRLPHLASRTFSPKAWRLTKEATCL